MARHADKLLCLFTLFAKSQFWESLTIHSVAILVDFPSFLWALASNDAFIIKLFKMWLGGIPGVVFGTLQISLGCLFFSEHNCTPSGKKMVTGLQVVTASQVQIIECRWQAILSCP